MIFSSKDFIIALKRNWSVEDIMKHYGITQEEVMLGVERAFSNGKKALEVKKQLKSNSKKQNRSPIPSVTEEISSITEDVADDCENADSVVCTVVDENQSVSASSLDSLKAYESELREAAYAAEVRHKELITKKSSLMDSLQKERDELARLKALLLKHNVSFENFVKEYNTVTSDLNEVNSELLFLRDELKSTQQAIESLKKITIYIYPDGTIVAENFSGELPDSDTEMVKQFSVDERFEDLTLKELRQLCKLLAFVAILKSDEKQFECIFDHEMLEIMYNKLNL